VKWTAEPTNPGWLGGTETQAINGLMAAINSNNATLISGIAHANSGMSLDVYDYDWESDYHNTKPFFLHDYGCHCGDFTAEDDGVLHSMLFHDDHELAFAVVYNTGYGWGNSDGTNSSSALQQKLFWDYFFDLTNNSISTMNWQLGKAMAWSKDKMAPTINWTTTGAPGSWRGIIESCLLFGDPAQRIKPPFQPDHGIAVTNLDVQDVVAHNKTVFVKALVSNIGKNNETNIIVDFTVNGSVISTTQIYTLNRGESNLVEFSWNPDVGTYLVGVYAHPVPGENITSNNEVNKTVQVIYAPDIWVNPGVFDFFLNADVIETDDLTIGNMVSAEAPLHFDIDIIGGSPWLSIAPDTGDILVGQDMNSTLTVNTTDMMEGLYSAIIKITSNDLEEPLMSIPVGLEVVYDKDITAVSVNSPVGVNPIWGTYIVNATVANVGTDDQTGILVNCSIRELGDIITEDFESDDGGYTHSDGPSSGYVDDWEWGQPTSGPMTAHSGSNLWATNLDGDHSNYADGVLDSVEVDLSLFSPLPQLTFWHWCDVTTYDCGNVKISTDGGSSWNIIYPDGGYPGTATSGNQGIANEPAFTSSTSGWEEVVFNLSAYEGETVQFRWHFGSTSGTTHPGWYIDDVSISSGLAQRSPGDIVYTSQTMVDLQSNTQKFIEFSPSWHPMVGGAYAFEIETYLLGDQDTSNDGIIAGAYFAAPNQETYICEVVSGWNMISLPFNQSVIKSDFYVMFNGSSYSWENATTGNNPTGQPLVDMNLFGWNAAAQLYSSDDILQGGCGYWLFSFQNVQLWSNHITSYEDGFICDTEENWNMVGVPDVETMELSEMIVFHNGTSYSWSEATTGADPLIDANLFSWDRQSQTYDLLVEFNPGHAAWLFSHQSCTLKKPL
jgi:hypothetical protein